MSRRGVYWVFANRARYIQDMLSRTHPHTRCRIISHFCCHHSHFAQIKHLWFRRWVFIWQHVYFSHGDRYTAWPQLRLRVVFFFLLLHYCYKCWATWEPWISPKVPKLAIPIRHLTPMVTTVVIKKSRSALHVIVKTLACTSARLYLTEPKHHEYAYRGRTQGIHNVLCPPLPLTLEHQ